MKKETKEQSFIIDTYSKYSFYLERETLELARDTTKAEKELDWISVKPK